MSPLARAGAFSWARWVPIAALLTALSMAAGASAASAATFPATCSNLQSTITAVAGEPGHGAGETIVLSGLCTAGSLGVSTGVTLPAESNFSIEGAPGTTSGFDGAGVTAPLLGTGAAEVGTMTISHLTFQHAHSKSQGAALSVRARTGLTLSGDTFLENTAEAEDLSETEHPAEAAAHGALFALVGGPAQAGCPPAGTVALTLTASTFRANRLIAIKSNAEGAGAWLLDRCETAANVITANAFEANRIEAGESHLAFGAGLDFVGPGSARPDTVTQIGNVFDSNAVAALSGAGDYGGGGEWLEGASLTSVGDRFSRNTASGTSGAPNWSWGAGLGVINTTCNAATPTESVLENAVVEGNGILGGVPADSGGAGIYVGCTPSLSNINHLTVLDSTITENSVDGGGVTGIEGNSSDHLVLANSILADIGGPEIGGFEGPGGSVSVSYSDVCAPSSSAPLTGTGNICANPLLADNGNPASYDVHETVGSPTIAAGNGALVPAGLATDFFGAPRTTSESFGGTCTAPGTHTRLDMGAAQDPLLPRVEAALLCVRQPVLSRFAFPSVSVRPNGVLVLSFKGLAAGRVSALATFRLTRIVVALVKGHRHHVRKVQTIGYATAAQRSPRAGNRSLTLKPNRRSLALLKSHHRLHVALWITFTATGLQPAAPQTRTVLVTYRKPPPPKHR